MTYAFFEKFVNEFVKELRKEAPYDKGNLSKNAIKFTFKGNEAEIYVDLDVAFYMIYTNEPWISPRWNGKKNPNEAWWNKKVVYILEKLAKKHRGRVENGTN